MSVSAAYACVRYLDDKSIHTIPSSDIRDFVPKHTKDWDSSSCYYARWRDDKEGDADEMCCKFYPVHILFLGVSPEELRKEMTNARRLRFPKLLDPPVITSVLQTSTLVDNADLLKKKRKKIEDPAMDRRKLLNTVLKEKQSQIVNRQKTEARRVKAPSGIHDTDSSSILSSDSDADQSVIPKQMYDRLFKKYKTTKTTLMETAQKVSQHNEKLEQLRAILQERDKELEEIRALNRNLQRALLQHIGLTCDIEKRGTRMDEPDETTDKPDEKTDKPDEKTDKPDEKTDKPDEKTDKPDEKTDKPDEKTHKPDEMTHKPDEKTHKPDEKTHKPDKTASVEGSVVGKLRPCPVDMDSPTSMPPVTEETVKIMHKAKPLDNDSSEAEKSGWVDIGKGLLIRKSAWEQTKDQKNSIFVKNLAVAIWGTEDLKNQSIIGRKCPKFMDRGARLPLTPWKYNVLKDAFKEKLQRDQIPPVLHTELLKSTNKYMSEKINDLNKNAKKRKLFKEAEEKIQNQDKD